MFFNTKKFIRQAAAVLTATIIFSTVPAAAAEKIDSTAHLSTGMEMLTQYKRGSGYEGERAAAQLLAKEYSSYGYSVFLQAFPALVNERSFNPVNVIAVRKADIKPDTADILIISSHFDSMPQTVGAVDNASGTAVILETARLIAESGIETDKELRFIAFGGEEYGLLGSYAYASELSDAEKSRIIGNIQLDMLGHRSSSKLTLKTVNGDETLLSQMVSKTAEELGMNMAKPGVETRSDHTSFMRNGVPAMLLEQDKNSYENHAIMDDMSMIDMDKLNDACSLLYNSVLDILNEKPAVPLSRQAREITDFENISAVQQTRQVLGFGLNLSNTEIGIGLSGKLVNSGKNEVGDNLEFYAYPMRWFGMDKPLTTIFKFRNEYLDEVEIEAQKDGYSYEQIYGIIKAELGNPTATADTDNGKTYAWGVWKYRKYYELSGTADDYTLTVYDATRANPVENTYNLAAGTIPEGAEADAAHQKIWRELISKILMPEDYKLIGELVFYSDGYHGMTGYTQAAGDGEDNTYMRMAVDVVDVFDDFGRYRNFDRSAYVIIHEYGHVLSLNATQVTLNETGDVPVFYDNCNFLPDSYMRKFFETFCQGLTDGYYSSQYIADYPQNFVSPYATQNVSEDFADSFAAFVLAPEQTGETVGEQKVNFFYQFPELVKTRDYIRGNFGWE